MLVRLIVQRALTVVCSSTGKLLWFGKTNGFTPVRELATPGTYVRIARMHLLHSIDNEVTVERYGIQMTVNANQVRGGDIIDTESDDGKFEVLSKHLERYGSQDVPDNFIAHHYSSGIGLYPKSMKQDNSLTFHEVRNKDYVQLMDRWVREGFNPETGEQRVSHTEVPVSEVPRSFIKSDQNQVTLMSDIINRVLAQRKTPFSPRLMKQ